MTEDGRENYHPIDHWDVLRKKVTRLVVLVPCQDKPDSLGFTQGTRTINGIMDLFKKYLEKLNNGGL